MKEGALTPCTMNRLANRQGRCARPLHRRTLHAKETVCAPTNRFHSLRVHAQGALGGLDSNVVVPDSFSAAIRCPVGAPLFCTLPCCASPPADACLGLMVHSCACIDMPLCVCAPRRLQRSALRVPAARSIAFAKRGIQAAESLVGLSTRRTVTSCKFMSLRASLCGASPIRAIACD